MIRDEKTKGGPLPNVLGHHRVVNIAPFAENALGDEPDLMELPMPR
jgi:hypothetical protein